MIKRNKFGSFKQVGTFNELECKGLLTNDFLHLTSFLRSRSFVPIVSIRLIVPSGTLEVASIDRTGENADIAISVPGLLCKYMLNVSYNSLLLSKHFECNAVLNYWK